MITLTEANNCASRKAIFLHVVVCTSKLIDL